MTSFELVEVCIGNLIRKSTLRLCVLILLLLNLQLQELLVFPLMSQFSHLRLQNRTLNWVNCQNLEAGHGIFAEVPAPPQD